MAIEARIIRSAPAETAPDIAILPETAGDDAGVDAVLEAAFGPGRHAKTSARVREIAPLRPDLSRIACANGVSVGRRIWGCCRIYDIRIGEASAFFLGPLAVHPALQRSGLGAQLVDAALAACRADGAAETVVVVGQPALFERFGFTRIPADRVTLPGPIEPRRLQWLELAPGAFARVGGTVSGPRVAS